MTCQYPLGAVKKRAQRLTKYRPPQPKSDARALAIARQERREAKREPVFRCRFCQGMSWCRESAGCPLGPVGCGLPFAPERYR